MISFNETNDFHFQKNVLFICVVFVPCGIAVIAGCIAILFLMDNDEDEYAFPLSLFFFLPEHILYCAILCFVSMLMYSIVQ